MIFLQNLFQLAAGSAMRSIFGVRLSGLIWS